MNDSKYLPKFELDDLAKSWLHAVWSYLLKHGTMPSYRSFRATVKVVPEEFDPNNIDKRLAEDYATKITLLGVLQIAPEILEEIDKVGFCIKRMLEDDPERENFSIPEIASELNLDLSRIRIVFELASFYGFRNGASGNPEMNFI